jgi:hypothetical protein
MPTLTIEKRGKNGERLGLRVDPKGKVAIFKNPLKKECLLWFDTDTAFGTHYLQLHKRGARMPIQKKVKTFAWVFELKPKPPHDPSEPDVVLGKGSD